jgi:hypothetical protein
MKRAWTVMLAILIAAFHVPMGLWAQGDDPRFPEIGPWLIDHNGLAAHWLGEKIGGRGLREPINVIIRDPWSKTREEAVTRLLAECARRGYEEEVGHSGGYWADMEGILYPEIPDSRRRALANKEFFFANNHGRVMGPVYWGSAWVFAAAFSREAFHPLTKTRHVFVSFTIARNDFCRRLDGGGLYRIVGSLDLGNVLDDAQTTTADHDGKATILEAAPPQ